MQLDKVVYFILGVVNILHLSPSPSYITIILFSKLQIALSFISRILTFETLLDNVPLVFVCWSNVVIVSSSSLCNTV